MYNFSISSYRGEQDFLIIEKSCFTQVFGDFELSNKIIKINFEYFIKN